MKKLFAFLQYNNAVPVVLGIVVLGASGAFAATDPQAIYSSTQKVVTVDNTYIASVDLSSYAPRVQITGVTEDSDNYYVAYTLSTIDVENHVWRDVAKPLSLTVSKSALGFHDDLGLYVTGKLNDMVGHELDRLRQTQEIERKSVTPKTVSTTYGGLVGKFLDPSTDTLPGYTPVIAPPAPEQPPVTDIGAGNTAPTTGAAEPPTPPPSTGSGGVLQLMGNDPARVPLGATYADLGVFIADPAWQKFGVHLTLDGGAVDQIQIDTSTTSAHTIVYQIENADRQSAEATRSVEVFDPNPPPAMPAVTSTASVSASSTPGANDNVEVASSSASTATSTP